MAMELGQLGDINGVIWKHVTSSGLQEVKTIIKRVGPTEYTWRRAENLLNYPTTKGAHGGYVGGYLKATTLNFTSYKTDVGGVIDDFILAREVERVDRAKKLADAQELLRFNTNISQLI